VDLRKKFGDCLTNIVKFKNEKKGGTWTRHFSYAQFISVDIGPIL
jgi:hypothetical protein